MNPEALRLAQIVWDYHQLGQRPVRSDVILALGTNDLRVAEFAADLYLEGLGEWLVCTGGVAHQGDLLETGWPLTEAGMFAEIAKRKGVPENRIVLETRATNTAENIRFARGLLGDRAISVRSLLIAVKPFMQRRTWATLAVEWPDVQAALASPPMTLEEYFTPDLPASKVIHILVGDLQRLWIYGRKGWSAEQTIPAEVRAAYDGLVALGFTKHLIPEE